MTWRAFPPDGATEEENRNDGGYLLLMASLIWSSTFDTISYRLGSGLNAQSLVRGWVSQPLAKEQWKVEAERIFEASLARIQIEARNIARGAGAAYDGLSRFPSSPALCKGSYLFRSQGWQNINVTGSICIGVVAFVIVVLAWPCPGDRLFAQLVGGFLTETIPYFVTEKVPYFLQEKLPEWWRTFYEDGLLGRSLDFLALFCR